jgi:hypothetical protein
MLDVKGDVATADAMSRRKETAKKIREKGADYILSVKENQKGHGRIERREIRTATGLWRMYGREVWGGLETIIQYRTYRRKKGEETVQTDHYYLSSGDFSVAEFLKYIRGTGR